MSRGVAMHIEGTLTHNNTNLLLMPDQGMEGKHSREKPIVPKFASFKRKATSPLRDKQADPHLQDETQGRRDDTGDLPSARMRHRHRTVKHQLHQFPVTDRENHRPSPKLPGADAKIDDQTFQEFVSDKTGDAQILTYGSLDRYAIPKYSRIGAGHVVGSLEGQKIDRTVGNNDGLILSRADHGTSAKERYARWKSELRGQREVKIKPYEDYASLQDADLVADFIHLDVRAANKRRRLNDNQDSNSPSPEPDRHYRSIDSKAGCKSALLDLDLRYNDTSQHQSDTEDNPSSTAEYLVQQMRTELSRRVEINPNDVYAWLNLINYQDNILVDQRFNGESTSAERRSNAEVKISIYKKALSQITQPKDRESLLQGMMEEGCKVWDSKKALSQWNNVLQENPGYCSLWTKYLDFKQASFPTFRYEDVQAAYLECLSKLSQARNDESRKIVEQEDIFEVQVIVMLRMTLFMRESGFPEFAVGAWQAILEFQFFKPLNLQGTVHEPDRFAKHHVINAFEEFWDCEVPRLGEEGAEGWQKSSVESRHNPQPKTKVTSEHAGSEDTYTTWAASERRQGLASRAPARTVDDVEENDPYRVILYSDIQPFLVDSPSLSRRRLLLDAFLIFCQLPPCYGDWPTKTWWQDGFMQNGTLHRGIKPHGLSSANVDCWGNNQMLLQQRRASPFDFPIPHYWLEADTLFANSQAWFSIFDACYGHTVGKEGPFDNAWVLRAVKTLASADLGDNDNFAEFSLALELHLSSHTVRKSAKAILKKRPSSLLLYNACALIEYRLGNTEKGQNILLHSINMAGQLRDPAPQDAVLLWHTWIWELLSAQKLEMAFRRLTSFAERKVQSDLLSNDSKHSPLDSPALLLRTESALISSRDHLLSVSLPKHAAIAAELIIFLSYFRDPSSLATAALAFRNNLAVLAKSHTVSQEYLCQFFGRLLYYHTLHTQLVKPAEVRALLADSISAFPQNTIFLSLYAWNEARFRIDDRVRSIVKEVVLSKSSSSKGTANVISHFFAIHNEIARAITSGSNTNAIRSTFERAVKTECGEHCAGLWKMYLLYECSQEQMHKAKDVFYRSIRACPWAKDLYMTAFEHLHGAKGMTDADLRGVYELMAEKELRVHVDLADLLESRNQEAT